MKVSSRSLVWQSLFAALALGLLLTLGASPFACRTRASARDSEQRGQRPRFSAQHRRCHPSRRALGWDVSSHFSMGMDQAFGPGSFGHTGYTGCLLWIDPATQGYLIVLTNRLHPDGHGDAQPLREDLGPLAAALIRASLSNPGGHAAIDRQQNAGNELRLVAGQK